MLAEESARVVDNEYPQYFSEFSSSVGWMYTVAKRHIMLAFLANYRSCEKIAWLICAMETEAKDRHIFLLTLDLRVTVTLASLSFQTSFFPSELHLSTSKSLSLSSPQWSTLAGPMPQCLPNSSIEGYNSRLEKVFTYVIVDLIARWLRKHFSERGEI